jgi:hypothetical protein
LSFELEQPDKSGTGPGTGRLNPLLLDSTDFIATLHFLLDQLHEHFDRSKTVNTQVQWDIVKNAIRTLAVQEGKSQKFKLDRQLLSAENRRKQTLSRLYVNSLSKAHAKSMLADIAKEIADCVERETRILCFRSSTTWHEKGERSNAYFYKVLRQRTNSQTISSLRHPINGELSNDPAIITSHASLFYQNLFEPDPVDQGAIESLIHETDNGHAIPQDRRSQNV